MSVTQQNRWYATGRRKTAVARVWIMPGSGKITINQRAEEVYFPRAIARMIMRQPLEVVESDDKYDLFVNVTGGGTTGQSEAIRHGIARALCEAEGSFRASLKAQGFLTRDSRAVERKKYGRPGARRRFQFSKR
ncbi:MAG: 30S ribosomal protein S9 [Myxococcota bacterium]|jgi:small subunit ribosomal protein S9|nr:30S ribosomal protein S9 [Myxococcota bacterium]